MEVWEEEETNGWRERRKERRIEGWMEGDGKSEGGDGRKETDGRKDGSSGGREERYERQANE